MSYTVVTAGDSPQPAYQQERIDLAAAFRWTARLNLHESVANHFSLAVNSDGSEFLINPNGRHFSRIEASELLLLQADDHEVMKRPGAPDPTAWAIHSAMHRNLPQARCILHVHSKYATALACLADSSMPPIDQNTMRFYERMAIDEGFDGMGLGDEAERLTTLLDEGKNVLMMGNHGVMVVAETVAQAFDDLYYFERACETLITAYSTGKPLRIASHEVAQKTAQQWQSYTGFAERHFSELKLILDDEEPSYKR